ncbi:helix-turn-helix domain-containing protein [Nonomuraea sp. NPDC003754]
MLLTIAEVAYELRLCERSVYRLIEAGDLPVVDVAPRRSRKAKTRVARIDLESFVQKRRRV